MLGTLAALTLLSPGPVDAAALCPASLLALIEDRVCVMGTGGIVIADDPDRANNLVAWALGGRARFAARLAIEPASFLIIDGGDAEADSRLVDAAGALGYVAVLTWLSPAAVQRQLEEGVARTVRQRMAAAGLDEARLDQIVAGAVAQVAAQADPAAVSQRDSVVVPHELAHKWLATKFWPSSPRPAGQYGGPIPDGAEEMVAIAAEPDHSLDARREQFWQAHHGALANGRASPFADLTGFLASAHPMSSRMNQAGGKSGFTVQIVDTADATSGEGNPAHYYLQALQLFDLLTERGLDRAALVRLLASLAQGIAFEDWLASEGGIAGLPLSLAELDVAWRERLSREAGN